jgi:nucleoprotein TPR
MKKRMLLKRKKAALEAKKKQLEAIKASAANESVAPAGTDADDSGSTSKASLPPVPEMKQSASTPITFGASTTTTNQLAFGVPKTAPMPSEPDCPKPSFFGSSTVAKPTFGSSVCGDGVKPSGETKSAEAFAFNPAAKPFASFATSTPLDARGAGGGAFLNLTPPGMSGAAPGKFVFGKSASITLTAPSVSSSVDAKPNPFASFGHTAKFGSSPFGASIGTSPFGGGESKKRSLDASEQPDAKKSHKDDDTPGDDDAAKTSSTKADDGAAKEA